MKKTTVVHHSADYDGIFCREIARKFLPEAEFIGWDFVDPPLGIARLTTGDKVYVMDLPVEQVFAMKFGSETPAVLMDNLIWIDHHKSAIDSHPKGLAGYRIDGVAACRLAWQWFLQEWRKSKGMIWLLPDKTQFLERLVEEPLAVRLVGEYDVWEHKLSGGDDIAFQFGLDSFTVNGLLPFDTLLSTEQNGDKLTADIVEAGGYSMRCYAKRDADVMRSRSFLVNWEGLNFLALNTPRCNSNTYASLDIPETGHDALMAFFYNGKDWNFSLYHAAHRKDLDLSKIAVKYGGGGHRGACGFRVSKLPF